MSQYPIPDNVLQYLYQLRNTGKVNMIYAGNYLERDLGLDPDTALKYALAFLHSPQPVYRRGTLIKQILWDQWSRGLQIDQAYLELKSMGYWKIPMMLIHIYWKRCDAQFEQSVEQSEAVKHVT